MRSFDNIHLDINIHDDKQLASQLLNIARFQMVKLTKMVNPSLLFCIYTDNKKITSRMSHFLGE